MIIFIHIDGFQQQSHIDEALVHLLFHNVGIGRQKIERNQWILRMKSLTASGQYRAGRELATSDADAALQRFVLTYEFLLSARATSSSARRRSSAPSLVKAIFLAPRSMSFTPGSYSSMDSWRDKVGCVICSTFAARVMFSSRTTVRK